MSAEPGATRASGGENALVPDESDLFCPVFRRRVGQSCSGKKCAGAQLRCLTMRWNHLQNPHCGFVCAALFFPEKRPMNALLIYPEFSDTFWSFKHALKLLDKRAAQPPLG